ncbi:MAG: thiamine/thiamine pyrophosphate ABC transporter permease ThiP [Alphaproteobacteria bacterium]|nr:thiamine/thiamine pyrophosphate ABC transporter permease ThiP [Alphaproteobacteria bacterium]
MAERFQPGRRMVQGLVLCALLLGLLPLFEFLATQGDWNFAAHGVWPVVVFTLKQALISTLISVVAGIAVAHALLRQNFPGRALFLKLLALPMAMPAIVAVLGLVSLFGNSGLLPGVVPLYGFTGIVLAHVFFNLPMCARLFFQALQAAPEEGFKLAAQLNMGEAATFRHVEWPQLQPAIARVASLVFLLCAASFVIALNFGGASATTLEVAIYQSLRLDFDVPRALQLSLVQVALSGTLIWLVAKAFESDAFAVSLKPWQGFRPRPSLATRALNIALVCAAALLVLPVLLAVLASGLQGLHFTAPTWQALGTSLALGLASAVIALLLAWPLARADDAASHLISLAAMILPPAVMATGWFILLRGLPDSWALSFALIVALNSLMALPFAAATLTAGFRKITPVHERLASQLGLQGLARLRIVELPVLRPHLAQALLMAMVNSLGDLTAITLFGSHGILTLPSLQQAEMGHYRGAEAAGTAALLLLVCGALTFLAHHLAEQHDHA